MPLIYKSETESIPISFRISQYLYLIHHPLVSHGTALLPPETDPFLLDPDPAVDEAVPGPAPNPIRPPDMVELDIDPDLADDDPPLPLPAVLPRRCSSSICLLFLSAFFRMSTSSGVGPVVGLIASSGISPIGACSFV